MFILIQGRVPFGGNDQERITNILKPQDKIFPRKEWKNWSAESLNIMKKTMNKNYSHRYSAKDVMYNKWITDNAIEIANPCMKPLIVLALRNCRKAISYGPL